MKTTLPKPAGGSEEKTEPPAFADDIIKTMKKKITAVLVTVILLIFISWLYNEGDKNIPPMGSDSPANATYRISGEEITLKDGKANIDIVLGSATQEHVRLFGEPAYADIDSDGDEDAVSFLTTDAGGSGTFFYVVAAINKDGRYFGTDAMFLGDRIAPQNINFIDGRFVANYADRLPGEPFSARPSIGKSVWIHFDAKDMTLGEFVKDFEGETR